MLIRYKNLRLFSSFSMYKASLQCSWDAEAPFRLKAVAKTRERGPFFAVVERNSNTASSRLNSSLLIDFILLSLAKKMNLSEIILHNSGNLSLDDNFTTSIEETCGFLNSDKYKIIQQFSFWIEGVSMAIFGFLAIITNALSVYVFTR